MHASTTRTTLLLLVYSHRAYISFYCRNVGCVFVWVVRHGGGRYDVGGCVDVICCCWFRFPFPQQIASNGQASHSQWKEKGGEKKGKIFNNLDIFHLNCFRINNEQSAKKFRSPSFPPPQPFDGCACLVFVYEMKEEKKTRIEFMSLSSLPLRTAVSRNK